MIKTANTVEKVPACVLISRLFLTMSEHLEYVDGARFASLPLRWGFWCPGGGGISVSDTTYMMVGDHQLPMQGNVCSISTGIQSRLLLRAIDLFASPQSYELVHHASVRSKGSLMRIGSAQRVHASVPDDVPATRSAPASGQIAFNYGRELYLYASNSDCLTMPDSGEESRTTCGSLDGYVANMILASSLLGQPMRNTSMSQMLVFGSYRSTRIEHLSYMVGKNSTPPALPSVLPDPVLAKGSILLPLGDEQDSDELSESLAAFDPVVSFHPTANVKDWIAMPEIPATNFTRESGSRNEIPKVDVRDHAVFAGRSCSERHRFFRPFGSPRNATSRVPKTSKYLRFFGLMNAALSVGHPVRGTSFWRRGCLWRRSLRALPLSLSMQSYRR